MPLRPTVPALAATALVAALGPTPAHATSGGLNAEASRTPANAPQASTRSVAARPASRATINLVSSPRVTARLDPLRSAKAGTLRNGEATRVRCQVNAGPVRSRGVTSRVWNRVKLRNGRIGYVPDVYMATASKNSLVAPLCGFPDPKGPTPGEQGRCRSVASVELVDVPTGPGGVPDPAAFSRFAAPFAQESKRATRVPAAVTLAQGILESASGTLAAGANNFFGIKAHAVPGSPGVFRWGPNALGCVHKQTNEVEGGRVVRRIASFRMYTDLRGSFVDHGLFLVENSRYAPAFEHVDDPEAFAKAIHKAGYATDPAYSTSLIRLMNRPELNLKQYD